MRNYQEILHRVDIRYDVRFKKKSYSGTLVVVCIMDFTEQETKMEDS